VRLGQPIVLFSRLRLSGHDELRVRAGGGGQLVEALLGPDGRVVPGVNPLGVTVGQDDAGLHVVGELRLEHLAELGPQRGR